MIDVRPAGRYGVDAPWVPWLWTVFGVVYLALAACAAWLWGSPGTGIVLGIVGVLMLVGGGFYWYATLRGKFAVWREILAELPHTDRALDLGCGRGAVAVLTAQRFPDALVEGIDLWRSVDQSGNDPAATRRNIAANGLGDRILLTTGDMTALPYPDDAFDLVTASLSIHNIHSADGRRRAIDEAWRVLAPGGRLRIVDISKVHEYERRLHERGGLDVECRAVGPRMWWSGPWMTTTSLQAIKPRA